MLVKDMLNGNLKSLFLYERIYVYLKDEKEPLKFWFNSFEKTYCVKNPEAQIHREFKKYGNLKKFVSHCQTYNQEVQRVIIGQGLYQAHDLDLSYEYEEKRLKSLLLIE